jgi:hypothetical protein
LAGWAFCFVGLDSGIGASRATSLGITDSGVRTASLEAIGADVVLLVLWASVGSLGRITDGGIRTAPLEAVGADVVVLVLWASATSGLVIADGGIGATSFEASSADVIALASWANGWVKRWGDWIRASGLGIADGTVRSATIESVRAHIPIAMSCWTALPVLARPALVLGGSCGAAFESTERLVIVVASACWAGGNGPPSVDGSSDRRRN